MATAPISLLEVDSYFEKFGFPDASTGKICKTNVIKERLDFKRDIEQEDYLTNTQSSTLQEKTSIEEKKSTEEIKTIIKNKLRITFSEEVEDNIIQDSLFRKLISEIEINLNKIKEFENISLENKIYYQDDWEIPDYKKLVLSLNFQDIPFEKEMQLWELTSKIIHNRIQSLIINTPKQISKQFKEFRKDFYIKLEL